MHFKSVTNSINGVCYDIAYITLYYVCIFMARLFRVLYEFVMLLLGIVLNLTQ